MDDQSELDSEIAVFRAAFPSIRSAILLSGDGTGGSIKLDIPQAERRIFALLMDMCQEELIVTIARAARKSTEDTQDVQNEEKHGFAKWHKPNR